VRLISDVLQRIDSENLCLAQQGKSARRHHPGEKIRLKNTAIMLLICYRFIDLIEYMLNQVNIQRLIVRQLTIKVALVIILAGSSGADNIRLCAGASLPDEAHYRQSNSYHHDQRSHQ